MLGYMCAFIFCCVHLFVSFPVSPAVAASISLSWNMKSLNQIFTIGTEVSTSLNAHVGAPSSQTMSLILTRIIIIFLLDQFVVSLMLVFISVAALNV